MSVIYDSARVYEESYLIEKGVRSCALIEVADYDDFQTNPHMDDVVVERYKEIKTDAKHRGLYTLLIVYKKLKSADCYVYKYPFQRFLIDFVTSDWRDNFHLNTLSAYIQGKLLGYADFSMDEFLSKPYFLDDFNPQKHEIVYSDDFEDIREELDKEYADIEMENEECACQNN